jgi:sRNA-binding protein
LRGFSWVHMEKYGVHIELAVTFYANISAGPALCRFVQKVVGKLKAKEIEQKKKESERKKKEAAQKRKETAQKKKEQSSFAARFAACRAP